jgi:hypothetical protein
MRPYGPNRGSGPTEYDTAIAASKRCVSPAGIKATLGFAAYLPATPFGLEQPCHGSMQTRLVFGQMLLTWRSNPIGREHQIFA